MTTIYLVRHGETIWNVKKQMQGWSDSPLTERGVNQAKLLCERLIDTKIDYIYSSPAGRTLHTARIVRGSRNIPIIENEGLREIRVGIWEGKYMDDIERNYPEQFYNFWHRPDLYVPVDGETFRELSKRTISTIRSIIEKHKGNSVLVITHGGALKSIMSYFENRPLEKFWEPPYIKQTSLSILKEKDGEVQIAMYADDSHLKDMEMINDLKVI